jgi:hypothetical protein
MAVGQSIMSKSHRTVEVPANRRFRRAGRHPCPCTNDHPLGAALNDHPEDAFLGATDPRPGRQMERDHFRNNHCIYHAAQVSGAPESASIAAGKRQ